MENKEKRKIIVKRSNGLTLVELIEMFPQCEPKEIKDTIIKWQKGEINSYGEPLERIPEETPVEPISDENVSDGDRNERNKISEVFVKYGIPTVQIAINEIMQLLLQSKDSGYQKCLDDLYNVLVKDEEKETGIKWFKMQGRKKTLEIMINYINKK